MRMEKNVHNNSVFRTVFSKNFLSQNMPIFCEKVRVTGQYIHILKFKMNILYRKKLIH